MIPVNMWRAYPNYSPYTSTTNLYKKIQNYIMEIQGEGSAKFKPDTAIIYTAVVTESKDVKKAEKENSMITNQVINELKKLGIKEDDIETVSYNIKKTYDYVDGKQIFKSYEVKNELKITVKDLGKVGEVIDTSVENGANVIEKVTFTTLNPEIYYRKALNLAVKNAVKKSLDIGRTLNIQVNRIPIEIKEESYIDKLSLESSPYAGSLSAPKTTPILPKELEIKARVKVIFGYE
ncbi:SIMPL domain-containing protein [Clostridium sp. ZS2-4]|uniref:SIMPL domain-containing protein n=1 Tax=Clostridium sp. ZS2-4 TaxID=2987703 RepID=UPI00227D2F40|nr:SIMPL domain-containing protein [Clostridium sp. ZS2-4]MCY6355284.1 SIMPL domain-containing protein [Clostridium sp. ZS2-4]